MSFYCSNFLEMPKASGAIHPTFLIGGWLRVSQGDDHRLNSLDPCLTLEKLAMKKSLIALAVLAASGASFAQSSVTISGTFDPSVANAKTTYGNGNSVTQNTIRNNSQGTSQVTFKGVEDLGGGLKASFLLENDFDTAKDATGNFSSKGGEQYLAIEGGFGKIAAGAPNTPTLTAQSAANPFSTKIGGGFGVLNTSHVRNNNTVMYSTPMFSGFSAAAAYSFKTKADANPSTAIAAVADITDIGLNYANGPLAAGVSLYKVSSLTTAIDNKETNLYATYDMGVAKLGAGYYTEKGAAAGAVDTKGYNVSANVPLNASLNLLANYGKKDDKVAATNLDSTIAAIGLKYTLSKRTSVYARYVDQKNDNVAANAAKKVQTTLVGVQHNF
jgi:predicted porin